MPHANGDGHRRGWLGLAVACLAALGLMASSVAVPATATTRAAAALSFEPCQASDLAGWECAHLTVPRDYARPSAGSFDLAVVRLPATDPLSRVGSLFVNAGGPGIATIAEAPVLAGLLPTELRSRFDFVAWDPRGVGLSRPLEGCTIAQAPLPATGAVDWRQALARLRDAQAAANRACALFNPDVVPYIGTNNTVRDLDRLRAAVGDETLNLWAPSYGSRIGYVYAATFPDRVRAIIATGAVNPAGGIADLAVGIGGASDDALGYLFTLVPEANQQYQRVLAALEREALVLPSGYAFTRWDLAVRLYAGAAYESDWPRLLTLLRDLELAIFGGAGQDAAAAEIDAGLHFGGFASQGPAEVFINCLDYADRPDEAQQLAIAEQMRRTGPMTGAILATFPMQCAGMTVPADPVPRLASGASPVGLFITTATNDGRTPYRWTLAMADAFRKSSVVTYSGGIHTTFLTAGSECVNDAALAYLLDPATPQVSELCPHVSVVSPR